jgi:hypothetical protein
MNWLLFDSVPGRFKTKSPQRGLFQLRVSFQNLVPMVGFEPTRLASPPPQDGVSTNFTTSAFSKLLDG